MEKLQENTAEDTIVKFTETDSLIIANEPDEKGAIVARYKTAAIPTMPTDEFDRQKRLQKIDSDTEKLIAEMKAAIKKKKAQVKGP